jgi:predicted enzyme related to lactoylglutathione lyase
MGRPVTHFEIGVRDLGRASGFYEDLFDWEVDEERTPGYRLVRTAEGSLGGGLLQVREDMPPYVMIYVGVTDLRATLEKAEELGAKVVMDPMPVPGVGSFAVFQDPDGEAVGIFEELAA